MSRLLIALGGNALGDNPKEQIQAVKRTAISIVKFIREGHEVIITHGNGPQVGMIQLAMESAIKYESKIPEIPLAESVAMSQGYIGYHLQNGIGEELNRQGIIKPVVTVITQVIVDPEDPAFKNPTKPIGNFYTEEEAKVLAESRGYIMKEDSGRGWRKLVPSPKPIDIVEKDAIISMVNSGNVVIAVGGGGIPVVREGSRLVGVPAVIDKDLASEKLAEILDCDYLLILTAVDRVSLNFRKDNERKLMKLRVEEAAKYAEEGHFPPGSMLPKIQAAMDFANSKPGRKSIITSLEKAYESLLGREGTLIYS
ncbi:MAG: carbamate kinase [Tissierellia bacterium]|nr:carbamate kinase [Tissierellia bacterium]